MLVHLQGLAAFGDMHLTFVRAKGTVVNNKEGVYTALIVVRAALVGNIPEVHN